MQHRVQSVFGNEYSDSHENIQSEYLVQLENFHYFMSKFLFVKYFNSVMYLHGTCRTELTLIVYKIMIL